MLSVPHFDAAAAGGRPRSGTGAVGQRGPDSGLREEAQNRPKDSRCA